MNRNWHDPEVVGSRFLAALDQERWSDVAADVAGETLDAFRAWCAEQLRSEAGRLAGNTADTHFASLATLLGVSSAAEADCLSPREVLIRFAANVNVNAAAARALDGDGSSPPTPLALSRRMVDVTVSLRDGRQLATVRYDVVPDYFAGEEPAPHTLELIETADGWRVWDADLSGTGYGHIRPPARA